MIYIIIGAAFTVIVLIISFIIFRIVKKKYEAKLRVAEDKLREENLDERILNPSASKESIKTFSQKPYDMKYSLEVQNNRSNGIMLEIEEISEISKRKYMINPDTPFTIGSGTDNSIVLVDSTVDSKQCEIGILAGTVYICNIGPSQNVSIRRGKKTIIVGSKKEAIEKKEKVQIGNETLIIRFIKASI